MLAWVPRLLILAIVSSAGLASGCATIATGGVQAINIQSQPSGAECTLTRGGQSLGSLVTPGQLTVSRSGQAIKVTCRKAGYQDTGEFLVATREPLALLDSFPVGVVTLPGQAVDMASGAYAQYPEVLRVWLVPSGSMGDFANTAAGLSPAATSFDGQYFGAFRSRAIRLRSPPDQRASRLRPRHRNRHNGRVRRSGGSDACHRLVRCGCRQVSTRGRSLPRVGGDVYRPNQRRPYDHQARQRNEALLVKQH
jgi:hypothetical protein